MIQRIVLIGLFLFCFASLSAQSKFEPNYVFVAKHNKSKAPGIFTNGTLVVVFLKSGKKVRGELLIYTDYIDVGYQKISLDEITGIRRRNTNLWLGVVSSVAFGEFIRRSLDLESTEALVLSATAITGTTFILNRRLLRRYRSKKGWTYSLREVGRYEQVRPIGLPVPSNR